MTWSVLPTLRARVCTWGVRDGERQTEQEILKPELNAACSHPQVLCYHLEIQPRCWQNHRQTQPSSIGKATVCFRGVSGDNRPGCDILQMNNIAVRIIYPPFCVTDKGWTSLWRQHLLRHCSLKRHRRFKTLNVSLLASCKLGNCILHVGDHRIV